MYGIAGAIHWGGTIAAASPAAETALLVFYIAVTALGDGAFLDLALRYPRAVARRRSGTIACYLPGGLALVALPLALLLPEGPVEAGLGLVLLSAFILSIVAGFVLLVKWVGATAAERREHSLTIIVVALVVSSGADLLAKAGVLPGAPEAWTLMYGLVPLALARALTRGGASR